MSEIGDLYRDLHRARTERRAKMREHNTKRIEGAGLTYTTNNGGVHLVVHSPKGVVADFWPSTGKWRIRKEKRPQLWNERNTKDVWGRGTGELINELVGGDFSE